jgi:hypothetical protein
LPETQNFSTSRPDKEQRPGPAWLRWTGLPEFPGVVLFFVCVALSHELLDIIQSGKYHKLSYKPIEAALLGILLAAAFTALVRRFCPRRGAALLGALSIAMLPSVLFVFAPFRYLIECRYWGTCDFWTNPLLLTGISLCVITGIFNGFDTIRGGVEALNDKVHSWFQGKSSQALFLSAWVACTALLAWRGFDRLIHPELFAEGGAQYVGQALNLGWSSLGVTYDGFLHVVPRLISLLATSLAPVPYIPAVTVATCYLLAGASAAFIVRPVFRWLIPSDAVRFAAAILLCLIPAYRETLGNLANLHWILFFVLSLMVLKDPSRPYRVWELLVALLVVVSTNLVAALAPAAIIRLWLVQAGIRGGGSGTDVRARAPEAIFTLLIIGPTILYTLAMLWGGSGPDDGRALLGALDPAVLLRAWRTTLISTFLLNPLSGPGVATEIVSMISHLALATIAGAVLCILFWYRSRNERHAESALILAWFAVPYAIIAMIALARSSSLKPFLLEEMWKIYKWWMRYHYLPVVFGIVAWLALLRPTRLLPGRHAANVLAVTLCVVSLSQAGWYFEVRKYGEERRWLQSSATLERAIRTGCPRVVTVRTYPGHWKFEYRADEKGVECATLDR